MSTDTVRITLRALAGSFRREIDLELADSVSFNEVAEEVWQLMQAPAQSLPWRLSTAAGRPVNTTVQLRDAGLADGSVIIARPGNLPQLPAPRDGAEALSALPTLPVQSASSLWTAGGVSAALLLLGPHSALWLGLGLLVVHLYARSRTWIGVSAALLCGIGAWQYVGEFALPQLTRIGLAAGGAAVALAVVMAAAIAGPAGRFRHRMVAWGITFGLIAALCQLHPAAGIAVSLLALTAAPGISTRAANVRIPRLPTAGEDLEVSDEGQECSGSHALQARLVYGGIVMGAVTGAALCCAAAQSSWWLVALCLCLTASAALHAVRHCDNVATWTMHAYAVTAGIAAAWHAHAMLAAAPLFSADPWRNAAIVCGLLCIAAACTSPWWARFTSAVEPTSIVWIERAEMLLLAAALPLSLHCAGVFALIRGLG